MAKLPASKEALAEMNANHVVVQMGGKVRIAGWETRDAGGGRTVRVVVFSSPTEMKTLFANRFVGVTTKDADGNQSTKRKPLFDYWMTHADRPTAIGFTIDPKGGRFVDGRLNLWQGYGVQPKAGQWPLLRRHIVGVICSGNEDYADYLLRYIAYALQNPTLQSEVIVILRGKQGTGKGTLVTLLCDLFGAHGLQISDRKHLIGSFNAHLLQTCFLFADEAFWAGDKAAEGTLKRMATERTLVFEPKGVDAFSGPNLLTIMMASNESWVAPVAEDDRRYVVFDVSDARKEDYAYFDALGEELDNGGREAFLHDMLAMDLKDWHPRKERPETQALAEQKAQTADPLVEWLGAILADGAIPVDARDKTGRVQKIAVLSNPRLAKFKGLFAHAAGYAKHLKQPDFLDFIKKHGLVRGKGKKEGRHWLFPSLAEARQRFLELHPWWPPFEDGLEDWETPTELYPDFRLDDLRDGMDEEAAE